MSYIRAIQLPAVYPWKFVIKQASRPSPNQISTDDAQITFFPIQTNRRKYFSPCLLTDSSQLLCSWGIKLKKLCTKPDVLLQPFKTKDTVQIMKHYDITIQNWLCVYITVIGSIIYRALLHEHLCSRRCICMFSFPLAYSRWKLSHCLSHSWPTTQRTVLRNLPEKKNSLL